MQNKQIDSRVPHGFPQCLAAEALRLSDLGEEVDDLCSEDEGGDGDEVDCRCWPGGNWIGV